jgi:hypothetical protein
MHGTKNPKMYLDNLNLEASTESAICEEGAVTKLNIMCGGTEVRLHVILK